MQSVLIDMPPDPAAILASAQGPAAAAFLGLIELDEFVFLHRLSIQLLEHFIIFAVAHVIVPLLLTAGQRAWPLLCSGDDFSPPAQF